MKIKIGTTLQKLTRRQDITLKSLSKKTGVAASTLSEWNNNRTPKDPTQVKKVAEALGVTMHFLLFGKEDGQEALQKVLKAEVLSGTYEISIKKLEGSNE